MSFAAGGVDEQGCDGKGLLRRQRVQVLHESRAGAVQIESVR